MTTREKAPTSNQLEHAELHLDRMGDLGDTLADLDGEPVNVFGGIVGERVVARIVRYRRRRKHFVSGIVTEVLDPSPHRVPLLRALHRLPVAAHRLRTPATPEARVCL